MCSRFRDIQKKTKTLPDHHYCSNISPALWCIFHTQIIGGPIVIGTVGVESWSVQWIDVVIHRLATNDLMVQLINLSNIATWCWKEKFFKFVQLLKIGRGGNEFYLYNFRNLLIFNIDVTETLASELKIMNLRLQLLYCMFWRQSLDRLFISFIIFQIYNM
jgi:hypothetical protein